MSLATYLGERARATASAGRLNEELKLHVAELQRFKAIVDSSDDAIMSKSTTGVVTSWNHGAEQLFGYTADEIVGHPMMTLIPSERATEETEMLERLIRGGAARFETVRRHKNGRLIDVSVTLSPILDGNGKVTGVAKISRDITDRKRAEDALAKESARYHSILNIAQDGIHILDEKGRLVECNEAFLESLGRKGEDPAALRVHDWDAQLPQEQLEESVQALIAKPSAFETRHRRKDGSVFDVEVNAGGIVLDGKPHLLAAARTISERKRAERELANRQAQLEDLNRSLAAKVAEAVSELRAKDQLLIKQGRQAAMGEMVGNIAHQWRQPLNALGLVFANLRDSVRFGEFDQAVMDKAGADAQRLIQKMSSTINDFRNFFLPDREKVAFSALAQVRETLGLVDASFLHAGITLEVESVSELALFGFPNEFSQVLLNLLSNSRQAIQDSKVAQGLVTIRLCESDGQGCISVRDNGGGIAQAALDRLFEPYFSTKKGGTGIGLYMSRQIIEGNLGGRLEARNVAGGAEFLLTLPLAGMAGMAGMGK